jgi:hypothetical protein
MMQLSRVRVLFDLFDLFPVQHYFVSNVTIRRGTSLCRGFASDAHTRQSVGVHVEVQNVQKTSRTLRSGSKSLVRQSRCSQMAGTFSRANISKAHEDSHLGRFI